MATQPLEKPRCDKCGAILRDLPEKTARIIPVTTGSGRSMGRFPNVIEAPIRTDWEAGESDLHEAVMPRAPLSFIVVGVIVFTIPIVVGGLLLLLVSFALTKQGVADYLEDVTPFSRYNPSVTATREENLNPQTPAQTPLVMPPFVTATMSSALELVTPIPSGVVPIGLQPTSGPISTMTMLAPPPTNTRIVIIPTSSFPTITPVPPTPTLTPTRGPCVQKAQSGDTVFGLASRCGHRDMAVVVEVLRLNNMKSAAELQIGQELIVPWPTPQGGEAVAAQPGETPVASEMGAEELPPGVMIYVVKQGDTALSIVYNLNITMRILQDLNPEVRFEGCDYGLASGGPSCNVMVFEGQRLRVPAPPPTATIPPTLTGSETPLPTATATFNAPFSQSPSDNMLFEAFEFPTLRWTSSGRMAQNESFLLTISNTTAGITYIITTRETSFQLSPEWQPTDGRRHTFTWKVGIARIDGNNAIPLPYTTETRTFTWMSR
ncbi:MAG: LysM peptidoglycan-binding domain-containing protein [Anaerolineae bacterium]|nr:LysM peptidoglycan-binding domain-containing protein [Anaerolineae bacterium]